MFSWRSKQIREITPNENQLDSDFYESISVSWRSKRISLNPELKRRNQVDNKCNRKSNAASPKIWPSSYRISMDPPQSLRISRNSTESGGAFAPPICTLLSPLHFAYKYCIFEGKKGMIRQRYILRLAFILVYCRFLFFSCNFQFSFIWFKGDQSFMGEWEWSLY